MALVALCVCVLKVWFNTLRKRDVVHWISHFENLLIKLWILSRSLEKHSIIYSPLHKLCCPGNGQTSCHYITSSPEATFSLVRQDYRQLGKDDELWKNVNTGDPRGRGEVMSYKGINMECSSDCKSEDNRWRYTAHVYGFCVHDRLLPCM